MIWRYLSEPLTSTAFVALRKTRVWKKLTTCESRFFVSKAMIRWDQNHCVAELICVVCPNSCRWDEARPCKWTWSAEEYYSISRQSLGQSLLRNLCKTKLACQRCFWRLSTADEGTIPVNEEEVQQSLHHHVGLEYHGRMSISNATSDTRLLSSFLLWYPWGIICCEINLTSVNVIRCPCLSMLIALHSCLIFLTPLPTHLLTFSLFTLSKLPLPYNFLNPYNMASSLWCFVPPLLAYLV